MARSKKQSDPDSVDIPDAAHVPEAGIPAEAPVTDSSSNHGSEWDSLGLPQDFGDLLRTQRVLTSVPLRKPFKHEWVRTHSAWEQPASTLKLSGDRKDDLWILRKELVPAIPPDMVAGMTLIPTITRQGTVMMWPIRVPQTNGRQDDWSRTALGCAREARAKWIQLHANSSVGAYEYRTLADHLGDPEWPEMSWDAIRELAFRNRFIDSLDHPILQAVLYGK